MLLNCIFLKSNLRTTFIHCRVVAMSIVVIQKTSKLWAANNFFFAHILAQFAFECISIIGLPAYNTHSQTTNERKEQENRYEWWIVITSLSLEFNELQLTKRLNSNCAVWAFFDKKKFIQRFPTNSEREKKGSSTKFVSSMISDSKALFYVNRKMNKFMKSWH